MFCNVFFTSVFCLDALNTLLRNTISRCLSLSVSRRLPCLLKFNPPKLTTQPPSQALTANRNNVDAALTWILSNGEALAAEDQEEAEREEAEEQEDGDASKVNRWGVYC